MQRTYRLDLGGATNIPESARAALISAAGKPQRFADGQFIMRQGDEPLGFYVIISGQAIVGRYSDDGIFTVFGVSGGGDLLGEMAFFMGSPRSSNAVADGVAEVVHVDAKAFRKAIAADPDVAMLVFRSISAQLKILIERVDADRTMSVAGRLARMLLGMEHADGGIHSTQQELADLVGVSRVSLGTAFRQLRTQGAIAGSYGKVRIVDRNMLEGQR